MYLLRRQLLGFDRSSLTVPVPAWTPWPLPEIVFELSQRLKREESRRISAEDAKSSLQQQILLLQDQANDLGVEVNEAYGQLR